MYCWVCPKKQKKSILVSQTFLAHTSQRTVAPPQAKTIVQETVPQTPQHHLRPATREPALLHSACSGPCSGSCSGQCVVPHLFPHIRLP